MTTQPSDWAVPRDIILRLAVAKDRLELGTDERKAVWEAIEFFRSLKPTAKRARELDASEARHKPVAEVYEDSTGCRFPRWAPAVRQLPEPGTKLYATPRAAEAGDWLPIESAPDDIGLCVVYTPDQGDGERFDIDWKEDGVWQEHYSHFEHFMAVGGVNACGPDVACTGPGEQPEYTHYRPLKAPQAAMGAVGAGGGE